MMFGGFCRRAPSNLFCSDGWYSAFPHFFVVPLQWLILNDSEPWAFWWEVEGNLKKLHEASLSNASNDLTAFYQSTKNRTSQCASSFAISIQQIRRFINRPFKNQYLFCDRFLIAPVKAIKKYPRYISLKETWYYLYSESFMNGRE